MKINNKAKGVVWIAGDGFGSAEIAGLFNETGRTALHINPGLDRAGYTDTATLAAKQGAPGMLINNFFTPLQDTLLHDIDDNTVSEVYRRFDAYSYFSKRAIPHFINGGVIINIVPALGQIPARGQSLISALASGVIAMTRSWAIELAYLGFRTCAIATGFTVEENAPFTYPAIKRIVTSKDIFDLIMFLENSEMVDGSCISLEGGYIAGYARDF